MVREFISIDFETGNSQRVSACAFGYAKVIEGQVIVSRGYLIRPVGGHAPFQSKIHGIKEEHTQDKPDFGELFPEIKDIFHYPLVAHSLFDQQVLLALSDHFGLDLEFEYLDTCRLAKQKLPDLKNHKLKTLSKHYNLPKFQHHDAKEDAITCANIFLRLEKVLPGCAPLEESDGMHELKGMINGILADNEVNYKEAYELLYWLEDHSEVSSQVNTLHIRLTTALEDEVLDSMEAKEIKKLLQDNLSEIEKHGI